MEPTQAELTWDRGALEIECDRSAQVRDGVETYLGRKVFGAGGDLVVRVSLAWVEEQGRRRVEARVSQQDARGRTWGERVVTGDDRCESLDEQLTLVVALMVDAPEPAPEEPAPLPPPPPPPPLPPEHAEPAEILTAPSLQRAAPSPPHWAVLGLGVAALGATPQIGVGAGLAATYKPRGFWGVGVDAAWIAPRREALDGGSLDVSMLSVGASLCPAQAVDGGAWWSVCAAVQLVRLDARSRDLLGARRDAQLFAAPGAVLRGGRVVDGRFLVAGGLQAYFPVSPDRYVYRDVEGRTQSAFEVGSVLLMASMGVGLLSP